MIAIDTNVLERFLAEVFIPDLVLVETVWVLSRSYRVSIREIVTVRKDKDLFAP